MSEFREVTLEERREMMRTGVFDINGNIAAHPGYTGVHRLEDGTFYLCPPAVREPRAATTQENVDIAAVLAKRTTPPAVAPAAELAGRPSWWRRWLLRVAGWPV